MNQRIPLLNSTPIINPASAPMGQLSTWTTHNTHAYTQLRAPSSQHRPINYLNHIQSTQEFNQHFQYSIPAQLSTIII